jgi:hypothetical protein
MWNIWVKGKGLKVKRHYEPLAAKQTGNKNMDCFAPLAMTTKTKIL